MLATTSEWIAKAEGDWSTAHLTYRARKTPNFDAACFHAQQCAEKYLKAWLEEAGVPFPPTHNLLRLLGIILPSAPGWALLDPDIRALTIYAVTVRYPGAFATKADARRAIENCRNVRDHVRVALALPM